MNERQLDELKLTGNLPSPNSVGLAILNLTKGEDYSMGEITKVIQSDPALTGRIVKIANSASFAAANPVTSVAQAAMRLGVRSVRNVALGFTLVTGNRSGTCQGFDYEGYWSHSLAVAVMAQAVAAAARTVAPADAFTCGLLSGIGTLALASIHPERYSLMLERAAQRGVTDLTVLEREEFNLDHAELAAAMLRDWKLPEAYAFAVAAFERRDPLADAPDENARRMVRTLAAAALLARVCLEANMDAAEASERLAQVLADLQLSSDDFDRLRFQSQADWGEWGKALQIPTGTSVKPAELAEQAARALSVPADTQIRAAGAQRKGLRMIVVDDDPVSLRLLEHHLSREGHQILRASNGRQALIMALESAPQMIVTDWMMPEMDGIELCKALRRSNEGRGTYIILLTGREDEARVVEAFDAGADEYVVKPFNPRILAARVRAGQRMIELREQAERDRRQLDHQMAEMSLLNRKLEEAALTDVLTRLPNRRAAIRTLEQAVGSAQTAGAPLSVIMIDIDHFKQVNDRHGHDMGDLVLRETATVLRSATRKTDLVCRLGGEEFLVICPKAALAHASITAERIRYAVQEHVIGFGLERAVTISLGVASMECGARTVDELLKLADRRVYAAKAGGRNRLCASDEPPAQALSA